MEKSTDLRVVKTQKAFLEAIEELIKTKKLSEITISELSAKSNVNRNTFYYHFNNIYEFLDMHKQMIVDELNDILESSSSYDPNVLRLLCNCIRKHPRFMYILISPNCDHDFHSDIFRVAAKITRVYIGNTKTLKDSRDSLIYGYSNAGCDSIFRSWIKSRMHETPEEICDMITELSEKGPATLLFPRS